MDTMVVELKALAEKSRYPLDAFIFVQKGLDYTVRHLHGPNPDAVKTHVSGQQLCQGLRRYAIQQYGLMARMVLGRWRIFRSRDFGEIVFCMVEAGQLGKTDQDAIEDFDNVYQFADAFPVEFDAATFESTSDQLA